MPNDTVIRLIQPGTFDDQLTDVLRDGARALLAKAVEAEVADFLGTHADLKTEDGRLRVVRHGHLPQREVMTGIGPVAVRQPRVRDREAAADDPGRIRFSRPSCRPMRRSKSIETAADPLPEGYLDRRLRGGVVGVARQGCCGSFSIRHRAAEGGLAGRSRRWQSAISQRSATSTSGPTASIYRPVWRTRSNVSSCSSALARG